MDGVKRRKQNMRSRWVTVWWSCIAYSLASLALIVAEPNLPFGDVNVVVLTDVHSWIGGHGRKEPHLDADYGDVVSFYERLKAYCEETDKDLWFVMNGDWIDGTGLSLDGDPSHLIPLLEKMPWDVVNVRIHTLEAFTPCLLQLDLFLFAFCRYLYRLVIMNCTNLV
jgi:hypothetical protein